VRHGSLLKGDKSSTMIPRAEFLASGCETTILFIRPCNIIYFGPSEDPIFPADLSVPTPGGAAILGNSLPRATILGCADQTEIRDPETDYIWNPRAIDWNLVHSGAIPLERKNLLLLLVLGLLNSNTYNAVTTRPGSRFDAQRKLVGSYSETLSHDQWKVEVRKIFETSLARIQGDVLDVVRGEGNDRPFAKNLMNEENMSLCDIVKFQSVGWKNISLFWLITLPTFALSLWVLTIELKELPHERQQISQSTEESTEIVLTWLIANGCPRLLGILVWTAQNLCRPILPRLLGMAWEDILRPMWQRLQRINWRNAINTAFKAIKYMLTSTVEFAVAVIRTLVRTIESSVKGFRSGQKFYQYLTEVAKRNFGRKSQREDIVD
jgi:hypothetical protein